MGDLSFAEYARRQGLGGAFELEHKSAPPDSYFVDLAMMLSVARGADGVTFTNDNGPLPIRSGITMETEINGLAEKLGSTHYSSVTLGGALACLHAAEHALAAQILPELGAASSQARDRTVITPPETLLRDPRSFIAGLAATRDTHPRRRAASRYLSHMMFLFAAQHELHHCLLGHCVVLEGWGCPARLREIGALDARQVDDVDLYHGFELLADSHAVDALLLTVTNRLDPPTQLQLFDEKEDIRLRLVLLATSLTVVMWHALQLQQGADSFHPEPLGRLINILDHVLSHAQRRKGERAGRQLILAWLDDLRILSRTFADVDLASATLFSVDVQDALGALVPLRKRIKALSGKRVYPQYGV